jgi:hypothetical protein
MVNELKQVNKHRNDPLDPHRQDVPNLMANWQPNPPTASRRKLTQASVTNLKESEYDVLQPVGHGEI